ncbi:sporulation protein [Ornithinibacillus halophilus]|uniref:sporulation protein n=1 Tax=Ornithinibacillus halophilus TaxID=930117 RepID=UPI0009328C1B|nr:sporulation protein [Ornithinibacillus halophilus]
MDNTLLYLRESLSNYLEHDLCKEIYNKMESNQYENEEAFVNDLDDKELSYLESLVERELSYANNVGDGTRIYQLNEVYELLF